MAQSDGQIIIQVSLDDKEAKKGLDGIDRETDKLEKGASSKFSKISGGIKAVGLAAVGVVGAVAGLGLTVGGLAAPLVKAAAGAQAMNAQFGQVFGDLQKQAQTTINTLGENFGMMPDRIKPAFTQMTSMFKGLGLDTNTAMAEAEKAVTAVADAAAFYDLSFNDANAALNSFIKGNYEGGEAIGLFANETQMASYAVKDGLIGATKEWASLDEATKQATRLEYALAMQNMAGATGQATRESDSLENQLGNLNQAWENLKALLGAPILEPAIQGIKLLTEVIQNFDVAPFIGAFEIAKSNVSTAIDAIKNFVQNGLSTVKSYFEENGTSIRDTVQNAFNNAKSVIESVLNAVVPFVQGQLSKVKQYWSDNGEQILRAAKNAFEGIKTIIDSVMPAIQFVIEYVWNAIKNVITGALDVIMGLVKTFSSILTGDFKGMWEGIKQTFSGAINLIMGLMSLSFVGGIRTLVTNLSKTFINAIKTKWTTVVGLFKSSVNTVSSTISSWVGKLLGFIKNLATNFTSTVTTLRTTVVARFKELSIQTINAVKGLPAKMSQIGKDLMQGLINGIKGKAGEAVKAITGVVDSIINTATSILGIASPSRVMKQIGLWTGEGMANGVSASQSKVAKAMESIGHALLDVTKKMAKEEVKLSKELTNDIAKIETNADTKIYNIKAAAKKKKRNLTIAEKNKIIAIEKEEKAKIAELEAKHENARIKAKKDADKSYLDTVTAYIDNRKSLDQMSLINEALIWEQTMALFNTGTTERIKAQQNYQKAVEAVQKELVSINENYSTQIQKVHDDMAKQEETLTKAYEDAVDKRAQSLVSFKSLFDEFEFKIGATGDELLSNLNSQVSAFKEWQRQIEILSGKAIDKGLLAELREMGPNALPELIALNSMTNTQLTQYSNLYKEKSALARKQAEAEMIGMKKDTDKQITELRNAANRQLDVLKNEWDKKIKALTKGTATELSSLKQVGKDAGQGLLDGLTLMEGPLQSKAKSIADAIKNTIQKALDIRSPSRWMRDFVAGNMAKGYELGVDRNESVITKAAANLGEMMKPNIINPLRGIQLNMDSAVNVAALQPNKVSYNPDGYGKQMDLSPLLTAIDNLASRPVEAVINVDGRTFARGVINHINDAQQQQKRQYTRLRGLTT